VNSSLESLDLSGNRIQQPGAGHIKEILSSNPASLTSLNLSTNLLRRHGGCLIAQGLHANTNLVVLDVSDNSIGDAGAIAFAALLEANTVLRELNLANNQIRKEGCVILAPSLIHNTTLMKLDLSKNPLGAYGGRVIVHAYNNCKCEREMSFEGCDLSLEDVKVVDDFNSFDPEDPSGHYRLDLEDRFQRAVAQRLIALSVEQPGENIKNEKLDGQLMFIDENDADLLALPHEGIIEFDYIVYTCPYMVITAL